MRAIRTLAFAMALAAIAVVAQSGPSPIVEQPPISVNSRQRLADAYGREVIFHGTNVVAKGGTYLPTRDGFSWDDSFVAQDMEVLQSLGMNAIRLGTMWPGAEPVRGEFNQSYITAIAEIVTEAAGYNIRSLLDMHQDVLADRFCGEGVPNWAAIANTTDFPWPLQKTPYNVSTDGTGMPEPYSQCAAHSWTDYYPTKAVGEAFQNIYSNAYGLQDAWSNFWVQVAKTGAGLGSAVLGYELINEPWAGDVWADPLLMAPGVSDKKNLQPAYDRIAADIRTVDPTHAIFFEGVTWDWFNVGFTHVPGGEQYVNKSVLSYHFYIPPDFSADVQFAARAKDMARLKCGGMLTEFGVHKCNGCGKIETDVIMNKCDSMFQSWTFWQLKPFPGNKTGSGGFSPIYHPNGTINKPQAFNMSRTYAQAIAGTGNVMAFDLATSAFTLSYTVNAEVTLPETVVFASETYHYPGGAKYSVGPTSLVQSGAIEVSRSAKDPNLTVIRHDPSRVPVGTVISVNVTRV